MMKPDRFRRFIAAGLILTCLLGGVIACTPSPLRPAAPASILEPPPAHVTGTESYTLASTHVDQTFVIDVWAPFGASDPLPVVYVLDGDVMFATAAQAALQMIYARELPPMIIVGIGYKTDDPFDAGVLRIRDLTPTESPAYAKRASAGLPIPEGLRSGGADNFLRFIDEELKPFIAERYTVDSSQAALSGHSLGGLFTMYVALESPESFSRYLIGSPYLAWDDDLLFATEAAHARRAESWPVRIFLSAGGLEKGILETYRRMDAQLRKRSGSDFRLTSHAFPDETHTSVIGATISRGLRELF